MKDYLGYYNMDGQPIEMEEWSQLMQDDGKHVAQDTVEGKYVSTVLLGLDHNYDPEGPPLIFETMVFACDEAGEVTSWAELWCERYSTKEQALKGHEEIVTAIRNHTWEGYTRDEEDE